MVDYGYVNLFKHSDMLLSLQYGSVLIGAILEHKKSHIKRRVYFGL